MLTFSELMQRNGSMVWPLIDPDSNPNSLFYKIGAWIHRFEDEQYAIVTECAEPALRILYNVEHIDKSKFEEIVRTGVGKLYSPSYPFGANYKFRDGAAWHCADLNCGAMYQQTFSFRAIDKCMKFMSSTEHNWCIEIVVPELRTMVYFESEEDFLVSKILMI